MGLPPKLELLAVFSSSDTVVGTYTVDHALLWTKMLVCEQVIMYHSSDSYRASFLCSKLCTLHGCTCWLLEPTQSGMPALEHRWDVLPTCWPHTPTPHIPALGKGFAISFSQDLSACFKYQCSYLNFLQASLLRSCLHDKAKHALMQVQACSLYI